MLTWATFLIIAQIYVLIIVGIWRVFGAGRKQGKKETKTETASSQFEKDLQHLKEDLDELRRGVVLSNQQREEDFKELRVFVDKLEAAFVSHTGKTINGIDYRTGD